MPKHFGRRNGDRHKGTIPTSLENGVVREREFRDLEFSTVQHPPEHLAWSQDFDTKRDTVRLNTAVNERTHAIEVPAGQRELNSRHADLPALCTSSVLPRTPHFGVEMISASTGRHNCCSLRMKSVNSPGAIGRV